MHHIIQVFQFDILIYFTWDCINKSHGCTINAHGSINRAHGSTKNAHGSINIALGSTNSAHISTNNSHGWISRAHGSTNNAHGSINRFYGPTNNAHGSMKFVQDSTAKCLILPSNMFIVSSIYTLFKVPYGLLMVPLLREHVCITYQMVHGP